MRVGAGERLGTSWHSDSICRHQIYGDRGCGGWNRLSFGITDPWGVLRLGSISTGLVPRTRKCQSEGAPCRRILVDEVPSHKASELSRNRQA